MKILVIENDELTKMLYSQILNANIKGNTYKFITSIEDLEEELSKELPDIIIFEPIKDSKNNDEVLNVVKKYIKTKIMILAPINIKDKGTNKAKFGGKEIEKAMAFMDTIENLQKYK